MICRLGSNALQNVSVLKVSFNGHIGLDIGKAKNMRARHYYFLRIDADGGIHVGERNENTMYID